MSREIDVTGMLAIGNGESCPFCKGDTVFVASKENDIVEHMSTEHPAELNKALFKEPPPKPWLDQPFQLLIAKIAVQLKILNEERDTLVSHEEFADKMHAIYCDMEEFFGKFGK